MHKWNTRALACVVSSFSTLSLAGSIACSDSSTAAPQGDDGPLFLIQARTFTAEDTIGLLTPTPSLDTDIDYSRSLEQPGGGVLYAEEGIGTFMVGGGESPTITRYSVGPGNTLVAGDTLSFANQGVAFMYPGLAFIDDHKAYYLDNDQLQAIVFDPTEMAITGTIPLDGVVREGFVATFGQIVKREDGVYFPGLWYTDNLDGVPSGSMLIRIDPATDTATITSDARCTGMYISMTASNGDAYWFSSNDNTFARLGYGADRGVPDCALRLRAGETTFDPTWQLDLTARVGSAAVPIVSGGGSSIWMRVLDPSAAPFSIPSDFDTVNTAPAWQWYLLDVESDAPAVRNDERPLSPVGGFGLLVDGRTFVSTENADYSESTLIELTSEGFIERATLRGVIDAVARVR